MGGAGPSALGRADADDDEFLLNAVIDRVNTTWTVWQVTTLSWVSKHFAQSRRGADPIEAEAGEGR
ncbi:MAG: hypothetical protein NTY84_10355 [Verrucomicrobia bacterium]|nr:hypothetical protein [Verrucomicrobiota bacterium]